LVNLAWKINMRRDKERPRLPRQQRQKSEKMGQMFKTVFRSRHLALTVGIIAMTMMVASFVDFQFKTVSYEAFSEKAELTSFLGKFYGRLSLVSLVLQLVFAYRFIRLLGVGGIIMFLPAGLLIGSGAMFLFPGLIAGVLLRGADGSLKYSLDKTGRELLFLPVPLEIKKRTKVFIDMFVDRWFRGLAGGLLLLCTLVLGMNVKQISMVVMGLLVVWLILVFLMRKEYVNSFRNALEKRQLDPAEIKMHLNDTSTVNILIASLGSPNERQVTYALDLLKSVRDVELIWPVRPLLKHTSAEIRLKALEIMQIHGDDSISGDVTELLNDDDLDIRRKAVRFLCLHSDKNKSEKLQEFLDSDNKKVKYAALGCIAADMQDDTYNLVGESIIEEVLHDESGEAVNGRVQLAAMIGKLETGHLIEHLEKLLNDESIEVASEAMASVGRLKERKYIFLLIDRLADKRYRAGARQALVSFGSTILGTLNDHLNDTRLNPTGRKNIPRVMQDIPHQDAVDYLTKSLETVEPSLKYFVVKALNSLRSKHRGLKFNKSNVGSVFMEETRSYYEISLILQAHSKNNGSESAKLLQKALEEKQQQNLERIFRLLGLVYPPNDIFNAYQGIVSGKKMLHANAVEFLDNLLKSDVKKYIFPILDEVSSEMLLQKGRELFNVSRVTCEEGLAVLIDGRDSWLKACAIYEAGTCGFVKLAEKIRKAVDDPDSIVRETALTVLGRQK
ncbi:MAG: hypothetical protein JSV44_01370, partial [Candidatus Zixiibacteriota bacterium]